MRRDAVKAKQAPVKGLTAVSGPVGSGKTLLCVSQALTWARAGAVVASNIPLAVPDGDGGTIPQELVKCDPETGRALGVERLLEARSLRFVSLLDLCALILVREEWLLRIAETEGEEAAEAALAAMPWLFVLIDEAALEAAGRDWQHFPSALAQAATEVRKRKVVGWLACVEWQKVDGILRDLVGWVWHTEYVPGWWFLPANWSGGCFLLKAQRPEWEQKAEESPEDSRKWRPERDVIAAYDTHGIVSGLADRLELDRSRLMARREKSDGRRNGTASDAAAKKLTEAAARNRW